MRIDSKYLWITIFVLLFFVGALLFRGKKTEIIEKHFTDTITIVKYDTVTITKIKVIKERVVDTMYIEKNGEQIALPRQQRHFYEKSLFDAWVSGYDPKIDSIRIYPKTEYRTITNTVEKERTHRPWSLYAGAQIQAFSSDFIPSVSISLSTPKKWLISAKIGIYEKKPIYGLELGYKILEK